MAKPPGGETVPPSFDPNGRSIEDLVADYLDRLNAGEALDPVAILTEQPTVGREIIERLEAFVDLSTARTEGQLSRTLGDYTVRRQIGRGGMGVVYDAWQNSMDRRVALKVLPQAVAADTKSVSRFIREAQVAGRLSHPNIVHVHGMGVEEQVPYYAMEYVEGETLAQVLVKTRQAAPAEMALFGVSRDDLACSSAVAQAFAHVAEGLQHAHSKGVIHRDIKPSNLILDRELRLRILDFGLARLEGQDGLTQSGDFLGTPLYMSPEQARRKKVALDHRTDIYSLGATLYEVLTLDTPFRGKDSEDTLSQIITRQPLALRKLNPRIPRDLETIVLKCLRKDPADRYGTAEALGQDLCRFVRGDPIEAKPERRWEKMARWSWSRRGWLGAGAALVLLIAVAGRFAWLQHRESLRRLDSEYRDVVLRAAVKLEGASLILRGRSGEALLFGREEADDNPATDSLVGVEQAIAELGAAANLRPGRSDAPFHRARGLLILGHEKEALDALESILRRDPEFVPALVLEAAVRRGRDELERARSLEERARRSVAGEASEAWSRAEGALRAGRWKDASLAYGEVIERSRRHEELYLGILASSHLRRGAARLEIGEALGALHDFAVAQHLLPGAVEPALLEGKAYCVLGRKDEAERLFQKLHASSPSPEEFVLSVIRLYHTLKDDEMSLAWCDRIERPHVREMTRARVLLDLGHASKALEASRKATDLSPNDSQAACTHAWLLYTLQRNDEGLPFTRDAVRRMPESPMLHEGLALHLEAAGRFPEAVKELREALRLRPGRAVTISVLALYQSYLGQLEEAFRLYDKAQELAPRSAIPHYHRALTYMLCGREDEAVAQFDRAISLEPRWSWPPFNRASVHLAIGSFEEAIRDYTRALELIPKAPVAFSLLGSALERLGRRDEAVVRYLEALEMDPGDLQSHFALLHLLRSGLLVLTEPQIDRLERSLEAMLVSGSANPISCLTLAFARAAQATELASEQAIQWVLRGLDNAEAKAPGVMAMLGEALRDLLHKAAEQRGFVAHPIAILNRLPPCSTIDTLLAGAAAFSRDEIRAILERFPIFAMSDASTRRRLYLEATLLRTAGDNRGAAELFSQLSLLEGVGPQLLLSVSSGLCTVGEASCAASALRGALEDVSTSDVDILNAWTAISLAALKRKPLELVQELRRKQSVNGSERTDDLRWLLEKLDSGEPIRINCGGDDYTGADGKTWSHDRFYRGGLNAPRMSIEIFGTETAPLYTSQRYFVWEEGSKASYAFPLPPARYQVSLHFAETWFHVPGLRRFGVKVEGQECLKDYEPMSAGFATADVKTFTLEVADGILDIQFIHGADDHPSVGAIEIERIP